MPNSNTFVEGVFTQRYHWINLKSMALLKTAGSQFLQPIHFHRENSYIFIYFVISYTLLFFCCPLLPPSFPNPIRTGLLSLVWPPLFIGMIDWKEIFFSRTQNGEEDHFPPFISSRYHRIDPDLQNNQRSTHTIIINFLFRLLSKAYWRTRRRGHFRSVKLFQPFCLSLTH